MRSSSREEWQATISKFKLSGKTIKEWCQENGKNASTLKYWISRINRASEEKRIEQNLAPNNAIEETKSLWREVSVNKEPTHIETNSDICIQVGIFTIAVPTDFNKAAFIEICRSLKSLC